MWSQDVWLTLIHSLVATRPEENKVRDEVFPDQMHEVVQKQLGKPQRPESAEKRDHTDHVKHVKYEQSFAGSGMDAPNDEGIVFVASAEVQWRTAKINKFVSA